MRAERQNVMKLLKTDKGFGFFLGAFLSPPLLQPLGGCGAGQSTLSKVLSALSSGEAPLPKEAQKQLQRFETVYRVYSAEPEKKEQLDYFGFAFRRIRVNYVYEISDATLIRRNACWVN